MKVPILCALWFALLPGSVQAQGGSTTFSGEVSEGQTFRKSIGHGLNFALTPSSLGDSGWVIEVSPQDKPSDPGCTGDYSWLVTPPYHFRNVRYLDTSYGTLAQDVVRSSAREFNFVLNCQDYEVERKRVETVIYTPANVSKEEVDEARAKLGSSPLGKGRLWIEKSRITPGNETSDGSDLGVIHWIRFRVEIKFPSTPARSAPLLITGSR